MRSLLSAPEVIVVSLSLPAQTTPSLPDKVSEPSASLCVVSGSLCVLSGRVLTAAEGNPLNPLEWHSYPSILIHINESTQRPPTPMVVSLSRTWRQEAISSSPIARFCGKQEMKALAQSCFSRQDRRAATCCSA